MQVSVILPNYNHAFFLQLRIDSILNQTFRDFELIILDDASTDNSRDIIERNRKQDVRITHVVFNQSNSGSTFKQWEKGIHLARGKFIWIAESDDYCEPVFLETMVGQLLSAPNAILATCRSVNIDKDGNQTSINRWHDEGFQTDRWTKSFINSGKAENKDYLCFRNTLPNASAVVFRNDVTTELQQLLSLRWRYCGDWFFWSVLLEKGDISYTSEILSYQRHHNDTTRATKNFPNERERFMETVKCAELISVKSRGGVDWKNKNYKWIIEFYTLRTALRDKFSRDFWHIGASRGFNSKLFNFALSHYLTDITKGTKALLGSYKRSLISNVLKSSSKKN